MGGERDLTTGKWMYQVAFIPAGKPPRMAGAKYSAAGRNTGVGGARPASGRPQAGTRAVRRTRRTLKALAISTACTTARPTSTPWN